MSDRGYHGNGSPTQTASMQQTTNIPTSDLGPQNVTQTNDHQSPQDVPMTEEPNIGANISQGTDRSDPNVVQSSQVSETNRAYLSTPPTPAESAMDAVSSQDPITNGTKAHDSNVIVASVMDENSMDDTSQDEPSAGDQPVVFEDELKGQTMYRTMQLLKSKVDEISVLKQAGDREKVEEIYRKEMVPHMLRLRGSHREEIDSLQDRAKKIQGINEQLMRLYRQCDCVEYQVARMGSLLINPEDIPKLDHETRLKLLDEELAKRKELQKKYGELERETRQIEELCSSTGSMVEDLKPYIRQLIDKVPRRSN